jgi:pimeloyl-ACP methyl ester carboxylesterase
MIGTGNPHQHYASTARYDLSGGGTGPALILLHGLGGNRTQLWDHAANVPARQLLAPDLRGHGGSELIGGPGDFTFDGLSADVVALLDALRYPRAVVVGVSMGAGVAVNLALRHPSRVRGLLLIRPAWRNEPDPPNLSPLRHIGTLLRDVGVAAGLEEFMASAAYRRVLTASPAAAAGLVNQFRDTAAVERAARLIQMPMSTPFSAMTELAALAVETVVVAAPNDPLHPVEIAAAWAENLPAARLVHIKGRDRDPVGYRDDLSRTVERFVGSLARAGG